MKPTKFERAKQKPARTKFIPIYIKEKPNEKKNESQEELKKD